MEMLIPHLDEQRGAVKYHKYTIGMQKKNNDGSKILIRHATIELSSNLVLKTLSELKCLEKEIAKLDL